MPAFAAPAPHQVASQPAPLASDDADRPLPLRNDTILGVCEALGQEFGFNPIYLRIAFAGLFYIGATVGIGTYLALGAGVALARWLYPDQAPAAAALAEQPAAHSADNEDSQRSLAA